MPSRFQGELLNTLASEYEGVSLEERATPIDEELVSIIHRLWDLGYWTEASCAGGHPGYEREGYIVIGQLLTSEEKREVRNLTRRYGLRSVRIVSRPESKTTWVAFNSVGGRKWDEFSSSEWVPLERRV